MNRFFHFMIFFFSIWMCIFVTKIFAASLVLDTVPVTIDQSQEMEVGVTLFCSSCTSQSFLRGVFYPSGTSYFGYTLNNTGEWINAPGGSCDKYFLVEPGDLKEGSWSGKLKIKPDISNSYFSGPGEYIFKVARYTSSCSSPTWSSEKTIAISGPTPSSTPLPTSTSTPSNTSTSTPTHTMTPQPSPTNTITPISTPSLFPTITSVPTISGFQPENSFLGDLNTNISTQSSDVLGVEKELLFATRDGIPSARYAVKPYIIASLCIAIGLSLLSGVFAWNIKNSQPKNEDI